MTRTLFPPSTLRQLARSAKDLGLTIRIEATGPAGDRYSIAIFEQPRSDDGDGEGTLLDWERERDRRRAGDAEIR